MFLQNRKGLSSGIYTSLTVLFLAIVTQLMASELALANNGNTAGELEISTADGPRQNAILLSTEVSGNINGMVAAISVRQSFKNTETEWVNGRYVFPLPEGAAVDSLRIEIGERVIVGEIKQKEEAKKVFEQAKKTGKKAGLLQQHRPNLFSMAIANIGPGETITAHITFIDKIQYREGSFSLSLPTTLTPRYIPGAPIKLTKATQSNLEHQLESQGDIEVKSAFGWATNTSSVSDASQITPPQVYASDKQTSHRFSLDLSLNAGLELQSIGSANYAIVSQKISGINKINLANGTALMDSDLTLSWKPQIGNTPKAAMFQQKFEGAYYSMLLLAPPEVNATISLPRDITFIVDSSGSMAGQSMQQAKQALHDGLAYLSAGDRFNIVDFDSRYRPLFTRSQHVSSANIKRASNMIDNLNADGGTEMMGAMEFSLNANHDSSYLRQIVFITDGAIGNEQALFKLISNKLGDARLFTVGIGRAPNAYFMSKAAKFGRGSYTTISQLSQVKTKMAQLFSKIMHPVLRDVEVAWPKSAGKKIEQYPRRIPDLYAGEPVTVLVKSSKPLKSAELAGSMLSTPWQQKLKFSNANTQADNLNTVWAREKIAGLMDKLRTNSAPIEEIKPQITALGLSHQILTKFTSFVAVDKNPSKPEFEKAKHQNVPNLMPKGSTMPVPQTATPATLYSIFGVCMMLLSRLLTRRSFKANGLWFKSAKGLL